MSNVETIKAEHASSTTMNPESIVTTNWLAVTMVVAAFILILNRSII
ncbi:hypothetical protein [Oceanisphaera pacifica]|uniref:Uncharacterized protein n=1 Tax=Oceanisphaera pacifica TaxID=2818389 RepID=A0ABS3NEW3_9GAMM|nr:hypothetical protein [Oceanisphaera pacifica]MBO1519057.1 hypothetical protein [Oceanisphaera pacifica]